MNVDQCKHCEVPDSPRFYDPESEYYFAVNNAATVDAVPVVRCRDCKHLWCDLAGLFCSCGQGLRNIYNDTFCSYGERKDGDKH